MGDTVNIDYQKILSSCDSSKVIQNVELTQEQRNDLLSKISVFESYFDGLPEAKQKEVTLEKSYSADTFYLSEVYTEKERNEKKKLGFKTLEDIKKLVQNFKKNSNMQLTNEDIAHILTYTDTTDTEIDGKIGSFYQGSMGSCWFLSMLNNHASTPEGAKNISKRIKDNKNGTYTVTFQDPTNPKKTKSYTIKDSELKVEENIMIDPKTKEKKRTNLGIFSSGDKDVRLLEIATNKLLKDFVPLQAPYTEKDNNGKEKIIDFPIIGGRPLNYAIVHKALGYQEPIVTYQENVKDSNLLKLDSNWTYSWKKEVFERNKDTEIFALTLGTSTKDGKVTLNLDAKPTDYKDIADVFKDYNAENLICGSALEDMGKDKRENRYLIKTHGYNIEKIKRNDAGEVVDVVINDPLNSQFSHPVSVKLFKNRGFLDLFKNYNFIYRDFWGDLFRQGEIRTQINHIHYIPSK